MIALPSQRTIRGTISVIDWLVWADYLKLAVAIFLLCLMICVSCEDIAWFWATEKARSALDANIALATHLHAYTKTAEEWRLWQNALSIATPIANLLKTLEDSPLPSFLSLFAPSISDGMDGLTQLSQRLATAESSLQGLAQSSSMMAASAQFTRRPASDTLLELALVCRNSIVRLENVDAELRWMSPMAEHINSAFMVSVDLLEDKKGSVPLSYFTQQVAYLIEWLHQGVSAITIRSESLRHYQQMIQQDIQMMYTIIAAADNAQKTTAFFGNGVWRRLMDTVRANAILLLFANILLFVAEIRLYIEQKNKVRL